MYGKRLRDLRKSHKMTTAEVGKKIQLAQSSYAAYETEARKPPLDKLEQLANLYNVSADYIIGLTDDPRPVVNQDLLNMQELLKNKKLHWNGRPLKEEELEPIRKLLEMVVWDRLPQKLKQNGENE